MKDKWFEFYKNYRNIRINSEDDLLFQVGKTVSSKAIDDNQFNIIIEEIIKELQITPEDNILDLCCGNGLLTKYIAKKAGFIFGIDFSDTMLINANKYNAGDNIEYLFHDVKKINELTKVIKSKRINKVIIYDALAYFRKQELIDILESLNKSLVCKHSILLGSVLFKEKKWNFYNTFNRKLNYLINHRILGKNKGLGKWWQYNELQSIVNQFNYKMKIISQDPKIYTAHYRVDVLLEN